ncbi:sulfate ABC transporter ATP-binding protein [Thermus scotoductus]|uniref:Sulfate ABC transporter ATP-binding protein n=2 Tax=Thermus TaxID=270 RepID=A0A430S8T0_THESC|nr:MULTISPECIES: ABC transporter ATP-binding protein [Thermus]RTG91737.1 sulfate ABC transporter ATP-binding protein [Thermus scotoductus]RTG95309.1 sulfate ABC transporter ATP-binding protein [Thermus scotoductus]RTH03192.1 sulfate ABC transporter ATP-binding protein [Thermus scotoductus]RTH10269.1 sulfate ABC transporter ATP-binding protein [Thermus scotoductus]RTH11032.1 sulfate ABC transporter ATP-binding protein [Thermus scotoductus]
MAFLNISGVQKRFGHYTALENVNLQVREGEVIALIGHSGSGKSTLLAMIAGLTRPTKGEILLEGQPIRSPGPDRGVVFQNYSLLPWLSVYQNVRVGVDSVHRELTDAERARITEKFLRIVGLWEHRHKKPGEISGGMKQRTALARALATNPKILLLDEPFGALDALTRTNLQDELLKVWDSTLEDSFLRAIWGGQRKTILLVTHDVEEAIYLSDRIAVMSNGPAATIGKVVEVPLPRPRNRREMLQNRAYLEVKEELLHLLTVVYAPEPPRKPA